MVKLAGIVLLLTGSAGVGLTAIRRLERRVTALRVLVDALQVMECEMEFQIPPMKELLSSVARRVKDPVSSFLTACAREIDAQHKPLFDLWRSYAVQELPELKQSEWDVLFTLGGILGRYDAQEQRNAIAAAQTRLAEYLKDAVEERRRKGRVYGALSVSAGMFVLILLI